MPDFLLELRSEEIPARMQDKARADLARLFEAEIAKAGLKAAAIETFATPRRLVLIARDLPEATEAVREETKGPRSSAPPQALEGFLRKTGLTQDQLQERDGVWFAVLERPGRRTAEVLGEAIPAIIRAFPWPKSMRWGEASASTESLRWVRPLQGIVALLGEEIVPCEIAGVASGAATVGHRFHHPGIITIGSAADYAEKLNACHVIVDQDERARIIREGAQAAAEAAVLRLVPDEGLVAENAGLTEWPVPLLGRFDPAFLEVPPEVIQLTMRTNQKYFACTGADGGLAPNFVCTANIEASDGGAAIVAGNEKVLAARLSDAKFFWESDLKVPLADQAAKLGGIVFHEKLGTIADKVERVAKLARWLVEEGIVPPSAGPGSTSSVRVERSRDTAESETEVGGSSRQGFSTSLEANGVLAELAERAARLAKADLVTGMVGEFPELQGLIGGYIARAQGEPDAVADAIRDHYKPVGQGDEVPTAPVTVAVSLADKVDTLAAFFVVKERPTGSKDPFALRRSGLAIIALILANQIRLRLAPALMEAMFGVLEQVYQRQQQADLDTIAPALRRLSDRGTRQLILREVFPSITLPGDPLAALPVQQSDRENAASLLELVAFLGDRLKVQQREAGVRHDLIDAVFALGGEDDLVRLLARVKALQAFVETGEGADLLAGYKRAANILKKEGFAPLPLAGGAGGGPLEQDGAGSGPPPTPPASGRGDRLAYTPEPAEAALIVALDAAEPRAVAAVEAEDFEGAMAALASLRGPVDAFFDSVTVNDADPAKRAARLALLARMRDAVHRVADFSRIEG